jgi:hypothetical protein
MSKSPLELPMIDSRLIGAACTLGDADLRLRVREWSALVRRSTVERTAYGVRLVLGPDEPLTAVADLAARESECCPFYDFTITNAGEHRTLEVSAGPDGGPAVVALLGLE